MSCPYNRDLYRDATFQLSGPLVKDKLWFFGSYQFQQDYNSPAGVPKDFPSRQKNHRVFGKLNWQIDSKQKLMFAYHDDFYNLPDTGDAVHAPSTILLNHGHNPSPNVTASMGCLRCARSRRVTSTAVLALASNRANIEGK